MLEQYRKQLIHLLHQGRITAVFDTLRQDLQPQTSAFDQVFQWVVQWRLAQKKWAQKNITTQAYQQETSAIQTELELFLDALPLDVLQRNISFSLDLLLRDFNPDQMGRLDLVNCGQNAAFDQFQTFFNHNSDTNAAFYFISGAARDRPDLFVERLVFSLMDGPEPNGQQSKVAFERRTGLLADTTIERVQINPLPQGPSLDTSQIKFNRYLAQRRAFDIGGPQPNKNNPQRQALAERDYEVFVFELKADDWKENTTRFFEWLIPATSTPEQNNAKMLFFCIVPEDASREVQELAAQFPETCCHIDQLGAIRATDLELWLNNITTQPDEVLITSIVEVAMKQLVSAWSQNGLSMADVTPVFETLYVRSLKTA